MLVATNLRAPFTAMAPLLDMIQNALNVGTSEAGIVMAIPLFAFMLFSPFVPMITRKTGLENGLLYTVILIGLGILLRSFGGLSFLYLGTAIIGLGIAAGNVILPSYIKLKFPHKIPLVTSSYVLTMGLTAAISSAIVIPLAQVHDLNWRFAAGAFVILPIITVILWAPQARKSTKEKMGDITKQYLSPIWRYALAWQVTFFFACNSILFYAMISWLPSIFNEIGLSPEKSATLHGALQLASAVPGLILVPLINRTKDQRGIATLVAIFNLLGLLGLLLLPAWATFWTIIIGLGTGGGFILALSFMGLRTSNSDRAASLSSMSQTIGYLAAGAATLVLAKVAEANDSWQPILIICMALCVTQGLIGLFAGRSIQISYD
ncbi:MFS transporter [Kangiella sediminilitoris]|uniref:MFS transporter n=2 Tax=Kangiella sediminilitoris TaxID=1144748 RepID=A0A1B3B9W7_9GAMM|nr:MFS transporter [Kangiella sediminilitoris]